MTVHNTLGNSFREFIYQRALAKELAKKNLEFCREVDMLIIYDGEEIRTRRVDFLVENCILVKIKAVTNMEDIHLAQAINYLEAFNLKVGLLINFGSKSLQFRRLINTPKKPLMSAQSFNQ
ncbi:GxxExxY protein [Candidatus Gracilibacteria bacterium]|nr:GxxExxY protein [Candidatus Gracilibacteria bacterium]